VRRLDAPVAPNHEQPVLRREPQAGQARDEIALVGALLLTGVAVEDIRLDAQHGAQVRPAVLVHRDFANEDPADDHGPAVEVLA